MISINKLRRRAGQGPPSSAEWNALLDLVQSLIPTAGPGIRMSRSRIGTIIKAAPVRAAGGAGSSPAPFEITGLRYDAEAEKWYARVQGGFVETRDPKAGVANVIAYQMPTLGGVTLSNIPPPEFEVVDQQAVYCKVTTDDHGIVTDATIELMGPDTDSTHYQPPPETAVEGIYYHKLAVTYLAEGGSPTVQTFQIGGTILHSPNLWEGENVGGGEEIYKGRDNASDKYQMRTLKNLGGEDSEEEEEEEPEGTFAVMKGTDDLTIGFRRLRNRPDEEGSIPIILGYSTGEEEDPDAFIDLRRIGPDPSGQLHVGATADAVQIRGNGFDLNITVETPDGLVALVYQDGLLVSSTDV